ncbi:hypothetical protein H5P28_00265 [Ruficoccus amylovorans]|uniref:Uncharacterized protein n=1 Tax=Ruficoccus amylovorans TaxID=1804625 RepID=A0A842H8Y6_9BACT|nr:hypothetical protein [Ruficoccus amylovorans]MBC2592685.1 hypothetical protein [Ruficoccus amylovorans]
MSKTTRQIVAEKALLRCLEEAAPYLVKEEHLRDSVTEAVHRLSTSEFDAALEAIDRARRAACIDTETGRQWQILDAGILWLRTH